MADILKVKVVTPEGACVREDARSFTARSEVGEFCMLPNHQPILAALTPGKVVVERPGGEKVVYAIDGGFLEGGVDHANVIVGRCVAAADVEKAAIESEVDALTARLDALAESDPTRLEVSEALGWAKARREICE
ncbi:MAG: F0F1 ATP synthase subunit epsilon [Deltaproteobacteria bacterium]|nr:F0F1 ATP synthase subunit epsilon [Deltaproteobacteria bacterium]